jgi:glycoside hydrolase-like protein/SH3 domain-containing protein
MSIIDTPFNTQSRIQCLLSAGVRTVIRYYNFSNSSSLPQKRMELGEAQILAANGIQICVVFQQRQDRAEDFNQLKGFAAGREAYRYAQNNIGQPPGSAIYFGVDFDATSAEIIGNISPFFEGVKNAFVQESGGGQPNYKVGAYGSGLTCGKLTANHLIELTWLSMSRGFQGTQAALAAGAFHLAQRAPASTLCGLGIDFNDFNPAHPDFGAFTLDAHVQPQGPVTGLGDRYRVTARPGLRLREGPGTQFDIVGGLRPGQIVFVVSIADQWARVDIEGDGQVDGFASAGLLEKL